MIRGMKRAVIIRAALTGALLIFASNGLMGQAGRRVQKPAATPTPPPPEPTPSPKPIAKPQLTLKVVSDPGMTTYLVFPFPEHMQEWVVDRLKKSQLLDVTVGARANRSEAVRLAKEETEVFIVWVQLEDSQLPDGRNAGNRAGSGEVWINYSILSPRTGKTKTFGKVVLSEIAPRAGSANVLRTCYPTVRGDEYLLLQGSLEVATRIFQSFDVPVPPLC